MTDVPLDQIVRDTSGDAADVTIQELTKDNVGDERSAKQLEPLQAAGLRLALVLFSAIAVVIAAIFIVVFVFTPLPAVPVAPLAGTNAEGLATYKALVDSYKTLSDAQVGRATQLFQAIVGTGLLPTFTAILGYMFGRQAPA